jgi:CBS domain containing-hemolysin-like protein
MIFLSLALTPLSNYLKIKMLQDIALTFFLVFLNGFFVASEFAIVKVRFSQIELRARGGSKLANIAKHLINHLDSYLSATQLGITLASLGLGWIGESVVSRIIVNIIGLFGLVLYPEQVHSIALPVAFISITVLHIVFGELAPKSIAIQRPEQVALGISLPLRLFYIIFRPFIWILNTFANAIVGLMGFQPAGEDAELHSSEELRYLIGESSKSGMLDSSEQELLENVFEFSDTPIKQVMIPRGMIQGIETTIGIHEIVNRFRQEGFSRMPVYDKTIDNITGVINAKDLLQMVGNGKTLVLDKIIRPAFFVQENEKISKVLHDMQSKRVHLSIVQDEFGGTAGLVTMEDIIEEIVGEIQDEYDEEAPIVDIVDDRTFIVRAEAAVNDVNDYLPVALPEDEGYETVGGLIITITGRIPETNEIIELKNYVCSILKRSKRRVELLRLKLKESENLVDN